MNDLISIALQEYGISEIPGIGNNPRIIQYAKDIGYGKIVLSEDTAWCSIFLNWCAQKAGLEHSGQLNARSWLPYGEEIKEPKLGDIVIFWREKINSWKGHVGIVISIGKERVYTLGGNQSNMVNIKAYPKSRVLGFRRLQEIKKINK